MKADQYNLALDSLAEKAMHSILRSIYSNPIMLEQMGEIAAENKRPLVDEISDRSYLMAASMLRIRKEYLMQDERSNNKP